MEQRLQGLTERDDLGYLRNGYQKLRTSSHMSECVRYVFIEQHLELFFHLSVLNFIFYPLGDVSSPLVAGIVGYVQNTGSGDGGW